MNTLDQLDPLPKFELTESNRQKEDWRKAVEMADGTDWTHIEVDWYRNGRGQLSYRPRLQTGLSIILERAGLLERAGESDGCDFYSFDWGKNSWVKLE